MSHLQVNECWYNELYAVSQYKCLYLDMHGLIFSVTRLGWVSRPDYILSIVLVDNAPATHI